MPRLEFTGYSVNAQPPQNTLPHTLSDSVLDAQPSSVVFSEPREKKSDTCGVERGWQPQNSGREVIVRCEPWEGGASRNRGGCGLPEDVEKGLSCSNGI